MTKITHCKFVYYRESSTTIFPRLCTILSLIPGKDNPILKTCKSSRNISRIEFTQLVSRLRLVRVLSRFGITSFHCYTFFCYGYTLIEIFSACNLVRTALWSAASRARVFARSLVGDKEPLFTVKNPRARLVKVDTWLEPIYRFSHDRSLICLTYVFYVLTHGFKMSNSSINSNPWIYKSKWFFFELLLQGKLSFIRVYTQMIWRTFWRVFCEVFPLLKQVWSLGFLCSTVRRFCLPFLFDVLKWTSVNALLGLLNIIEMGLFYGGEYLEAKICRFWHFWQDGEVYLIGRRPVKITVAIYAMHK